MSVFWADKGWTVEALKSAPGSMLAILTEDGAVGIEGRRVGLELRDTILVLRPGPKAGFIFLFRKPVQENTVSEQMLATGTGGINIEACRVGTSKRVPGALSTRDLRGFGERPGRLGQTFDDSGHDPNSGRWPPNVVFIHATECVSTGTKKARATSIHGTATAIRRSGIHAEAGGHQTVGREQPVRGYADAEGQETVAAWECAPGCPVGLLDAQSGATESKGGPIRQSGSSWKCSSQRETYARICDAGGASRFFPQFRDEAELLDWLGRLLEPL